MVEAPWRFRGRGFHQNFLTVCLTVHVEITLAHRAKAKDGEGSVDDRVGMIQGSDDR